MRSPSRKRRSILPARVLPFLVVALAACGGGGGGNHDGGARTFDAANSKAQAPASYQASAALLDMSVSTGATVADTLAMVPIPGTLLPGSAYRALNVARSRVTMPKAATALRTKAVHTEHSACDAGEMVAAVDDRDDDGEVSVGDILDLRFLSCRLGDFTANGQITMTYTQIAMAPTSSDVSLSVVIANLTTQGPGYADSIDGDFSIRVQALPPDQRIVETAMSGNRLTSTVNGNTVALHNFESSARIDSLANTYTSNLRAEVHQPAIGRVTTITTPQPLAGPLESHPVSGSLKTAHQDGSSFTITPVSATEVRLDVDENGDGVVDATEVMPWSTLERW